MLLGVDYKSPIENRCALFYIERPATRYSHMKHLNTFFRRAAGCALALAAAQCAPALAQPAATVALAAQPVLVGEHAVSGPFHDFAPSLAPDGKTLLFTRTDSGFSRMTLMQSRLVDGKWQAATVLPFSGLWNDGDGVLSPDGTRYVFISNRPAGGNLPKGDLDLWQVQKRADGSWGEPQRLADGINSEVNEIYPSIAADGTLYFGRAGSNPVLRSRLENGVYQPPELLPFNGFSFAIAPDQRFGILGQPDASRNIDLYYVARNGQGWDKPVRLDGPVNSPQHDMAGSITPDGKRLLFVSTRAGKAQAWPRQRSVRSADDVAAELNGVALNGLRNIYELDLSALPRPAQ